MKKKIVCILLAVMAVAVGYVSYMESHFGTTAFVPVSTSAEQIRSEMPGIVFTEEDTAMVKGLLTTPELAEAFSLASESPDGFYSVPLRDAEAWLADYIPEGCELSVFTVERDHRVILGFLTRDNRCIEYTFDSELQSLHKSIGFFEIDSSGTRQIKSAQYWNRNGELTKYKEKRIWFDWLFS